MMPCPYGARGYRSAYTAVGRCHFFQSPATRRPDISAAQEEVASNVTILPLEMPAASLDGHLIRGPLFWTLIQSKRPLHARPVNIQGNPHDTFTSQSSSLHLGAVGVLLDYRPCRRRPGLTDFRTGVRCRAGRWRDGISRHPVCRAPGWRSAVESATASDPLEGCESGGHLWCRVHATRSTTDE